MRWQWGDPEKDSTIKLLNHDHLLKVHIQYSTIIVIDLPLTRYLHLSVYICTRFTLGCLAKIKRSENGCVDLYQFLYYQYAVLPRLSGILISTKKQSFFPKETPEKAAKQRRQSEGAGK